MCLVQQDNITVLCDVHEEHIAADRNARKARKDAIIIIVLDGGAADH